MSKKDVAILVLVVTLALGVLSFAILIAILGIPELGRLSF